MAIRFRRRSGRAFALAAVVLSLLAPAAGADEGADIAYVPVMGEGAVLVVDTAADQVRARIDGVGAQAAAVAAARDGRQLYVQSANPPFTGPDDIAVVDRTSNTVTARIPISGTDGMTEPIADPVRDRVYVFTTRPSIDVLDTVSNTLVRSMPLPAIPFAAAISPDGGKLYTVFADSTAAVFDPETGFQVGERIQIDGSLPASAAVSPDGRKLYTLNVLGDNVSVIDTQSWTRLGAIAFAPGSAPVAGAISPDGTRLMVATLGADAVQVIDLAADRVTGTVPVDAPLSVGFTADGAKMYVGSLGTHVAAPFTVPAAALDATTLLHTYLRTDPHAGALVPFHTATWQPAGAPIPTGSGPASGAFLD
ncbi:YncE family protein [Nocardia farcinica]|uniref:YncE family protein n=1 Tax=Nocardia farcinica TaxID=37329 RepID=UPI001894CCD1|nr:YncE family protein [Nocardia farcinica]MBF6249782.1 YncE family protein [Nocardia farcinica]